MLQINLLRSILKTFNSWFLVGASTACCQGTNPTPTQDAFCGWIFNIDPAKMVKTNVPICGEYKSVWTLADNEYKYRIIWWFQRFLPIPFFIFLDCVAPFSIDIEFDALSDEGAADPAAPAMTPNDKTSCGKFLILLMDLFDIRFKIHSLRQTIADKIYFFIFRSVFNL